ncbi:uncharacterized protein LOC144341759 [Saccoglossus kowalevskii]
MKTNFGNVEEAALCYGISYLDDIPVLSAEEFVPLSPMAEFSPTKSQKTTAGEAMQDIINKFPVLTSKQKSSLLFQLLLTYMSNDISKNLTLRYVKPDFIELLGRALESLEECSKKNIIYLLCKSLGVKRDDISSVVKHTYDVLEAHNVNDESKEIEDIYKNGDNLNIIRDTCKSQHSECF